MWPENEQREGQSRSNRRCVGKGQLPLSRLDGCEAHNAVGKCVALNTSRKRSGSGLTRGKWSVKAMGRKRARGRRRTKADRRHVASRLLALVRNAGCEQRLANKAAGTANQHRANASHSLHQDDRSKDHCGETGNAETTENERRLLRRHADGLDEDVGLLHSVGRSAESRISRTRSFAAWQSGAHRVVCAHVDTAERKEGKRAAQDCMKGRDGTDPVSCCAAFTPIAKSVR